MRRFPFYRKNKKSLNKFIRFEKQNYYMIHFPGIVLLLVSGIWMLTEHMEYFKQGWFHAKLLFVFILIITDVVLFFQLKKYDELTEKFWRKYKIIRVVFILGFLSLIFLASVRPF
jgi:uncharacterized membrane protein